MKKPMNYNTVVTINLYKRQAIPGDVLTLAIRNEDCDDGIYKQAQRLYTMFVQSYFFFPQSIAMHPDHLDMLKRQGKTLDVVLDEKGAKIAGALIDLTQLPTRIPLVGDEALDLFTVVARYSLSKEAAGEMAFSAICEILGIDKEQP